MPPKYTDELRIDAVKQVIENGYGVLETADWNTSNIIKLMDKKI